MIVWSAMRQVFYQVTGNTLLYAGALCCKVHINLAKNDLCVYNLFNSSYW